ncbi:hypothetical protein Tco_0837357, partial [Tanacetum coccineum]
NVRFYENVFPFKQKTYDLTDVESTNEVNHLKFFNSQNPQSPNDDGKDKSVVDGSLQPCFDTADSAQVMYQEGCVKYGIEKYVSYSKLKGSNLCFATTLNKSVEPTCLKDALSDPNWVEAMNNIEALT